MAKLIQYCTHASRYDGPFGGSAGWPAAGMGYVIVTDSGTLICIDGGHAEDAEDLLALLESLSPARVPEVALWILTHPHGDHMGALCAIAAQDGLCSRVKIRALMYDFPASYSKGVHNACHDAEMICHITGAKAIRPAPDQRMAMGGLDLHLLYTPEMGAKPSNPTTNPNYLSLIFTLTGAHKKVTFTGDAYHPSMQAVADRYGKELKSDILQMPHHGLCDASCPVFYELVSADTLLIPASAAGYRAMHNGSYADSPGAAHNIKAEQRADRVCNAFEGITIIDV